MQGDIFSKVWFYKDKLGNIQGPFMSFDMDIWNGEGNYFSGDLNISPNNDTYYPLKLYQERDPKVLELMHNIVTKHEQNLENPILLKMIVPQKSGGNTVNNMNPNQMMNMSKGAQQQMMVMNQRGGGGGGNKGGQQQMWNQGNLQNMAQLNKINNVGGQPMRGQQGGQIPQPQGPMGNFPRPMPVMKMVGPDGNPSYQQIPVGHQMPMGMGQVNQIGQLPPQAGQNPNMSDQDKRKRGMPQNIAMHPMGGNPQFAGPQNPSMGGMPSQPSPNQGGNPAQNAQMLFGQNPQQETSEKDVISNLQHFGTSSSEMSSNIKDLLGLGGFGGGGGGMDALFGGVAVNPEADFPPMKVGGNQQISANNFVGQPHVDMDVGANVQNSNVNFQSDDFPPLG